MSKPVRLTTVALAGALAAGCASGPGGGRTEFASPDRAASSLVTALRNGDRETLEAMLGPDGRQVLFSGDAVADRANLRAFLQQYDRKHDLERERDGAFTLTVGVDDWPLPIPIVRGEDGWVFSTERGKDELLARRIGRNELDAIQVALAITDAQLEYARSDPDGDGLADYAEKFLSDPGRRNGLFWQTAEGETPSPLGPLIVQAASEGYRRSPTGEPRPYHGYYYRMLTAQGPHAAGGVRDYRVGDTLLGGFGVVAWPASVGNSGVMTFIVNQDGVVYERYLGPSTDKIARSMTAFDPGPGWKKVENIRDE